MQWIVVTGLMASGKTTVGRAVADALGRPFRDSDAEIETATGRTARALAAADGIETLHDLERAQLLEALGGPPSVVAAAASVIDDDAILTALSDPEVAVVWLRVSPEVAASRARVDDHRPSPEPLAVQAARRDPRFASVARVVVDVEGRTPASIVRAVLDGLNGLDVA